MSSINYRFRRDTQEEKRTDKILKYHDLGLNNSEIAKLVECTRENVRQTLERLGLHSHVCWSKNREKEEVEA